MTNPWGITKRQAQALILWSEGKKGAEIALVMRIGNKTPYSIIQQARVKMEAFSTRQAAQRWAEYLKGVTK